MPEFNFNPILFTMWSASIYGLVAGIKKAASESNRDIKRIVPLLPLAIGAFTGFLFAGVLLGLPGDVGAFLGCGAGAVSSASHTVLRQSIKGHD
jgi:hypothetical protein